MVLQSVDYDEKVTTALVLSAGGMFAAWEAGVWKALSRHIQPDLIAGTSAGAWNGWVIAGGMTAEELIEAWLDPSVAAIRLFHPQALRAKAGELYARSQPRLPFGLTLAEIPRFRAMLVRGPDVTSSHLAATCSIPGAYPAVLIGGKRYVDGGMLGALPLWAAEEMGATRAIALNCLTGLPFRLIRSVLPPRPPSPALEIIRVEPSAPLGSLRDAVCWSRKNVERWIELGERDGRKALKSITM